MHATPRALLVSLGLVMGAATAQAAGTVTVAYIQPEKFADVGHSRRDVDDALKELTHHFEALAAKHLVDGQRLNIEVLDVDLAGEIRPTRRSMQDIRVLKGGADWPRIKLRYTLEAAGQAPRSAEQSIADMAYLQRIAVANRGDALHYEKRMLDEWFGAQFGAAAAR